MKKDKLKDFNIELFDQGDYEFDEATRRILFNPYNFLPACQDSNVKNNRKDDMAVTMGVWLMRQIAPEYLAYLDKLKMAWRLPTLQEYTTEGNNPIEYEKRIVTYREKTIRPAITEAHFKLITAIDKAINNGEIRYQEQANGLYSFIMHQDWQDESKPCLVLRDKLSKIIQLLPRYSLSQRVYQNEADLTYQKFLKENNYEKYSGHSLKNRPGEFLPSREF